ncbi:MAG TPA: glycosyltransferase family 39 protein, partial [Pirellulales bacterium]|nr:glycosyltransferase family 39 protein [Pirellulales bacterium]
MPLICQTPSGWLQAALICAALVIRGGYILSTADELRRDPDHYAEIARHLHDRQAFALGDPDGQPTAYRPPLYPLVLSVFEGLGKPLLARAVLHVALGVATVWLAWRLALRWGLSSTMALAAAALVMVDPILLNQSSQVMTETLAAFLAACALLALARAAREDSLWAASLSGGVLGLCVLCRPTFLVWFAAVAVAWPLIASRPRRAARTVALLMAAAMSVAPWMIRNQVIFGRPIVTTTHGGYTLLLANNPGFYEYLRHAKWGSVWDGAALHAEFEARFEPAAGELVRDRVA